jgi:replicative DNA helicase
MNLLNFSIGLFAEADQSTLTRGQRRLRQRSDLRLIVVDYLQPMTSGKRVESRRVEVSEFSRHLKLLAKELEVPVIAISQLNRGPEQRTDKKPMLAEQHGTTGSHPDLEEDWHSQDKQGLNGGGQD